MLERALTRRHRLDEVAIELTSKCNLQCSMCSVWKGRKDGLPAPAIEALLSDALTLGATKFVPFGAEIFMRKDTVPILETAALMGFRSINVVTNGMLVDRHVERLGKIRGLTLGISIDGPKDVHDGLRGEGSYEAAIIGLQAARTAGIPVSLKCVLMRPTLDTAAHLIDLARAYGATQVSYQPFQPEIAGPDTDHSRWTFAADDRARVERVLSDLLDAARFAAVPVFTEGLFPQIVPYLFDGHRPIPTGGCYMPSRFIMVAGNGETYPCFFMRRQSMGNVAKGLRLIDIWHSPMQFRMQERGLKGACPGCLASCSDLPSYDAARRDADPGAAHA